MPRQSGAFLGFGNDFAGIALGRDILDVDAPAP
jgi:hypothetical protein